MCILLILHTGKVGYNPCTHFPMQKELPDITGALRRVPAENSSAGQGFHLLTTLTDRCLEQRPARKEHLTGIKSAYHSH